MTLPAPMVAKLRRLLPMLASTHDGEVIATRNAIVRELASGKQDLHDLAAAISCEPEPVEAVDYCPPPSHNVIALARAVRDMDGGKLTARERAFVASMCALRRPPTEKQVDWLEGLDRRLKRRAAA